MITEDKKRMCVHLYQEGTHTIKEIMALTGIRSEQTVYRFLDDFRVPRRPKAIVHRFSFMADDAVARVLSDVEDVDAYINAALRAFAGLGD